jgi:hypothetical protein
MSQRGRPFEPGNTFGRGRPPGSRNKTTQKAREILESYSETITRKGIFVALEGETKVLIALLGYILGKNGAVPIKISGLKFGTIEELDKSSEVILKKTVSGDLPSDQVQLISGLIEMRRRVIETRDLAARVHQLESKS